MNIQYATSAADYTKCFEVMKELRPHHNLESFLTTMDAMQKEGYHLLYLDDEGRELKPNAAKKWRRTQESNSKHVINAGCCI